MAEEGMMRQTNPWLVLALLLTIYIFNFADRYLLTGLVGPIKAEFGVGDGFMGLLMGPAFVVLYVLGGVPIARLADRSSRVRIIAAGCVMWSLSTMATGFATGPVSLALARIGVGVGEAAFVAPAYSLLTDYFRPERRGLVFAILGLATYAGQIAGQGGGPALAEVYGWRNTFLIMGAPGLLLGVLLLLAVREPPRTFAVSKGNQIPFLTMVSELRQSPAYLLMMGAFGLGSLSGVAFGYWGPELFTRAYAIDPVAAKGAFALNFGLAGLVGMLSFGAIADKRPSAALPAQCSCLPLR
jgi:MFS family permease